MDKLDKIKNKLKTLIKGYQAGLSQVFDKFDDSKEYGEGELDDAITKGIVYERLIECMQDLLLFIENEVEKEVEREEELIKDIDEMAKLYKVKEENHSYYILKILNDDEYIDFLFAEKETGEPEGMIEFYKRIKEGL